MDPWLDNLFLYDDFAELRAARVVADAIWSFFASMDAAFRARTFVAPPALDLHRIIDP